MCGRYTLHHSEEALSARFDMGFGSGPSRSNLMLTECVYAIEQVISHFEGLDAVVRLDLKWVAIRSAGPNTFLGASWI